MTPEKHSLSKFLKSPVISSLAGLMFLLRTLVSLCWVLQTYFLYVSYVDVWWINCNMNNKIDAFV